MNSIKSLLTLTALAMLAPGTFAAQIAGYKFDDATGNTATDAVRGAVGNGTLNNFGGAQWVTGKIGLAIDFAGDNDYVLAQNALPTGTTKFTLSMWAWADANRQWGTLIKNWGNDLEGAFHLGFQDNTQRISNYLGTPGNGPVQASSVFTLNTWHHIALTWDGTTKSEILYIDGVQAGTFTTTLSSLTALGNGMMFGLKPNNTTDGPTPGCCGGAWDGKMDDIVFFDTVLTPADIQQIKIDGDNGISAVVPEPGSALLGLAGLAGLMLRRRRR